MSTVILKGEEGKRKYAPVPDGWTAEEVVVVLRKAGLEPTHLVSETGEELPIPKDKAA
jgi:hypothetical protein